MPKYDSYMNYSFAQACRKRDSQSIIGKAAVGAMYGNVSAMETLRTL